MYNVARNGIEIGQYSKEEIVDGLMTRFFLPTDHCWKPGMPEWKLLVVEFAAPVDPTLPPPPPAPTQPRPTTAASPIPNTPPVAPQSVTQKSEGRKVWLLGGFLVPYVFAWRIIFDRTYGFTRTTKVIYSVWMAFFLLPLILAVTGVTPSSNRISAQNESQESKNAAFLATLTPEQRIAVKTMQRNIRQALRDSFDYQDSNKDGKLDMQEFLGKGLFEHSNSEADFHRKDINNDGFLTFEETLK